MRYATAFTTAALLVAHVAVAQPGGVVSVPVLKAPVEKGTVITPDMLTVLDVPSKAVFASTLTRPGEVTGQQTVRPLPAGEPLNRMHLRFMPDVAKGTVVTLTYTKGGVELNGKGQALEDGKVGQSIKVLNPDSRATVLGTVTAAGMVKVN